MKAMILSAGYGTRLKPYTDELPKALVPYHNAPMINYQIDRLKQAGVTEIIINAHHFADQLVRYFCENDFGVDCKVIVEEDILGTGGGILNAKPFLENEDFFIVVNVDIDSDADIRRMIIYHESVDPFATLAVQDRMTFRHLEFDHNMHLLGRGNDRVAGNNHLYAFNGMHIISGRIFKKDLQVKFEDIIDIYIRMINDKSEFVAGYDVGNCTFKDLGKIKNLLS